MKTQFQIKVGMYWVQVSETGYYHYTGKKRTIN
jgi:hypothetical protein